jgi:tryptophan synthase alpha subunit
MYDKRYLTENKLAAEVDVFVVDLKERFGKRFGVGFGIENPKCRH